MNVYILPFGIFLCIDFSFNMVIYLILPALLFFIGLNLAGFVYSVIKTKKIWVLIIQYLLFAGILFVAFAFSGYGGDDDTPFIKIPLFFLFVITNVLSCFIAYLVHWLEEH